MEQEYFGVSLEKLLTSGCMVTDYWNNHRNYFGTDPCALP